MRCHLVLTDAMALRAFQLISSYGHLLLLTVKFGKHAMSFKVIVLQFKTGTVTCDSFVFTDFVCPVYVFTYLVVWAAYHVDVPCIVVGHLDSSDHFYGAIASYSACVL